MLHQELFTLGRIHPTKTQVDLLLSTDHLPRLWLSHLFPQLGIKILFDFGWLAPYSSRVRIKQPSCLLLTEIRLSGIGSCFKRQLGDLQATSSPLSAFNWTVSLKAYYMDALLC